MKYFILVVIITIFLSYIFSGIAKEKDTMNLTQAIERPVLDEMTVENYKTAIFALG